MNALHQARCFNHALREAVARCPSCRRFFCRECVTEHEDRLVCAACLGRGGDGNRSVGGLGRLLFNCGRGLLGLLVLWVGFHVLGQVLLQIPSELHEDVLWREHWWEAP